MVQGQEGWMDAKKLFSCHCSLIGKLGEIEGCVQESGEGRILTIIGSFLISVSEAGDRENNLVLGKKQTPVASPSATPADLHAVPCPQQALPLAERF